MEVNKKILRKYCEHGTTFCTMILFPTGPDFRGTFVYFFCVRGREGLPRIESKSFPGVCLYTNVAKVSCKSYITFCHRLQFLRGSRTRGWK